MVAAECAAGEHRGLCPGEANPTVCRCFCHPSNHRPDCPFPVTQRACTCFHPDTDWS